ncbi:4a-hydroxytetrahydrobiopterin dehydratase [Allorhodopirellula solitaria]|uniref:4a-hydroxytetrahydrobiopterin dehydratase n=1 Tax=Allorhodopirellula solitaria TaxID=2527987 RepID=A0A5C5YF04_9BACT|nr:4a-hydroxytetrahydrobiopterin dehydratase [Allorhodopirellula solitaria]TWT72915.1 putative pterin-4-alpha-carbinolamine dehydratase [Allorhodopirellula solitaria]
MTSSSDPTSTPDPGPRSPAQRRNSLVDAHCAACEGGVEVMPPETARQYLETVAKWELDESSRSISRQFNRGTFVNVIELINRIAAVAEREQHHPDLHVTGYRHLKVVLTTHAIGGLSKNDFIVAAKIDQLLD